VRTLEDRALSLLVIAVSLAFAWILWPFFNAVLWARVLAIVFANSGQHVSDIACPPNSVRNSRSAELLLATLRVRRAAPPVNVPSGFRKPRT
jgi:hypothetical protein